MREGRGVREGRGEGGEGVREWTFTSGWAYSPNFIVDSKPELFLLCWYSLTSSCSYQGRVYSIL